VSDATATKTTAEGPVHVHQAQNHMATTFRFVVSVPAADAGRARRALAEAHSETARIESILSEFREDSPVARLNRAPVSQAVALSPEAIELLERSERLKRITGGAFDCSAKSSARPASATDAVAWDRSSGRAWRLFEGARIGFGAIGKGYALDRAREILVRAGFNDFLLSAGGSSILLSGFAGPWRPWTWGWSWGRDADGDSVGVPFAHKTGTAIALGTSGTHEKGEHLIDARGAQLAPPGLKPLSALVAAPSAADADALSTALFVAGFDRAARFMSDLPFSPAMAEIDAQGVPHWNGVFRHLWGDATDGAVSRRTPHDSDERRSRPAAQAALALASVSGLSAASPQAARADQPPAAATAPSAEGAPSANEAPSTEAPSSESADAASTEEASIDLSAMSADSFAPYVHERHPGWIALPLFALAVVLIHLKKNRRPSLKTPSRSSTPSLLAASALLWATLEQAHAVELVPMGKALVGVLGTPKAFKKTVDDATFFYSKDAKGGMDKVAFIEKNTWQKQCTHTWIVGMGKDGKITQIVAQEQQCPHAKPAAAESFLEQYKGKGPADVGKLKDDVNTIAKATGSCELATEAAIHAINSYKKIAGPAAAPAKPAPAKPAPAKPAPAAKGKS
jgi:thiamine biosynthesis lipoprotein